MSYISIPNNGPEHNSFAVLFVEDSPPDADSVIWKLSRSGIKFEVDHFTNAEAARDALVHGNKEWDILLTDHDLLGMTGLELCHFVLAQQPEITSILMTGYGNESLAKTAIRDGVNEYIVKDTLGDYLDDLPETLHTIWEQHQANLLTRHARVVQERQMMNTIKQLELQNAELDSFAETVAHDLKSPLAVLSGFAEILESDEYDLQELDLSKIGRSIASCGHKAINIVDELLKMGRVKKGEIDIAPIDSKTMATMTVERVLPLFLYLSPKIEISETLPDAKGYAPWVEEVWVNYVSNAIKYGGRPCEVSLGGETRVDGMVRFWVRDNGNGLTEEEKACLFQPYTRLHVGDVEGTGLGLSIVKRIVERLGGEVGVDDAPGGGCEFWFTLPAAGKQVALPTAEQHFRMS